MVRLTLSHSRGDMARLAAWLDCQKQTMGLQHKMAFALRQCLEEAVANLIDHTPAVAGETIAVELDWQGDTLMARVEDSGPPFDPRGVGPAVRATNLETMVPGGWGIHLIRTFASAIDYQSVPGRNRLTLRFASPVAHEARVEGRSG